MIAKSGGISRGIKVDPAPAHAGGQLPGRGEPLRLLELVALPQRSCLVVTSCDDGSHVAAVRAGDRRRVGGAGARSAGAK